MVVVGVVGIAHLDGIQKNWNKALKDGIELNKQFETFLKENEIDTSFKKSLFIKKNLNNN